MGAEARGISAALAAVGFRGGDVRGMARHAVRLDGHRDRPPALAGHGRVAHGRCGRQGLRGATRREPDRVWGDLCRHAYCVHGGDHAHGGQGIEAMTPYLPLIFTVLMGFAILMYVVLDGYDLGVGMLMPA